METSIISYKNLTDLRDWCLMRRKIYLATLFLVFFVVTLCIAYMVLSYFFPAFIVDSEGIHRAIMPLENVFWSIVISGVGAILFIWRVSHWKS